MGNGNPRLAAAADETILDRRRGESPHKAVLPPASPHGQKDGGALITIVGDMCMDVVTLHRDKAVNALWAVAASIARLVNRLTLPRQARRSSGIQMDDSRALPSVLRNGGLD